MAGMTLEKHRETGQELADIRKRLLSLSKKLRLEYPGSSWMTAVRALDHVRDVLEANFREEYPGMDGELLFLYYPDDWRGE